MITFKVYFRDSKTGKYYDGNDGLTESKENAHFTRSDLFTYKECMKEFKELDATPEVDEDVSHDNMVAVLEMEINNSTFILDDEWVDRNKETISNYLREIGKIEEKIIDVVCNG